MGPRSTGAGDDVLPPAPAPAARRPVQEGSMGRTFRRLVLLGPGLAWWLVFLVVPLLVVLAYSFFHRATNGGVVFDFCLDNYVRALDPLYLNVLWFSLRVAVITTMVALLIGYPAAYFIATRPRRWRTPPPLPLILPLGDSFL